MELPQSKLVKTQRKEFRKTDPKTGKRIVVTVRFDDQYGNGHNSFAITAEVREQGQSTIYGCCHEEVAAFFPELEPLLKWHLCSTDGPMHYVANTTYHASKVERYDYFVRLRDSLIKNSQGVLLGMFRESELESLKERFSDFDLVIEAKPNAMNKNPDLAAARASAVWPHATLEELRDEQKLWERLPGLMEEFKKDVESLGFTY